jgi:hypothetical protein
LYSPFWLRGQRGIDLEVLLVLMQLQLLRLHGVLRVREGPVHPLDAGGPRALDPDDGRHVYLEEREYRQPAYVLST